MPSARARSPGPMCRSPCGCLGRAAAALTGKHPHRLRHIGPGDLARADGINVPLERSSIVLRLL